MDAVTWRKSSRSMANGTCVEVAEWQVSSFSGGSGQCVEVAVLHDAR